MLIYYQIMNRIFKQSVFLLLTIVVVFSGCEKENIEVVEENEKKENIETVKKEVAENENQEEVGEVEDIEIDTSDWLIMRSEICGIEFRYPKGYVLVRYSETSDSCNIYVTQGDSSRHGIILSYSNMFTPRVSDVEKELKLVKEYDKKRDVTWRFYDISERDYHKAYQRLMDGECMLGNFIPEDDKFKNDSNSFVNEVIVNCGNTPKDGKIAVEVFNSFKFIKK